MLCSISQILAFLLFCVLVALVGSLIWEHLTGTVSINSLPPPSFPPGSLPSFPLLFSLLVPALMGFVSAVLFLAGIYGLCALLWAVLWPYYQCLPTNHLQHHCAQYFCSNLSLREVRWCAFWETFSLPQSQFIFYFTFVCFLSRLASVEVIRLGLSLLINWDVDMYYEENDVPAVAR